MAFSPKFTITNSITAESIRIEVLSPGGLPTGMLPEYLGHKNINCNPLIADLLHRIEFIEKAGTGIKRMRDEARNRGCPDPVCEATSFFTASFYPNPAVREQVVGQVTGQVTPEAVAHDEAHDEAHDALLPPDRDQVTEQVTEQVRCILNYLKNEPLSARDAMQSLGLRHRPTFLYDYLQPAMDAGLVEMTQPKSPKSPTQKYRLTAKGKAVLIETGQLESGKRTVS